MVIDETIFMVSMWQRFWGLNGWIKWPVISLLGLFTIGIIVGSVSGGDDSQEQLVAQPTATVRVETPPATLAKPTATEEEAEPKPSTDKAEEAEPTPTVNEASVAEDRRTAFVDATIEGCRIAVEMFADQFTPEEVGRFRNEECPTYAEAAADDVQRAYDGIGYEDATGNVWFDDKNVDYQAEIDGGLVDGCDQMVNIMENLSFEQRFRSLTEDGFPSRFCFDLPTDMPEPPDEGSDAIQTVDASLGSNELDIVGADLLSVENPNGDGTFVYVEQTRFSGVERFIIWLVLDGTAYPLNGATKFVLPALPWPREAEPSVWERTGLSPYQATDALEIVFGEN